jgi:peptide/nickel transport system substrate-binding protein
MVIRISIGMSTREDTPNQKGPGMRSKLVSVVTCGVLAVLGLALASCGSSSDESAGETAAKFPPPTAAPDNAKNGGTLSVIAASDVDFIDPGAAYYQFTYMVTSAAQRALLSWQPDDVESPTPDLAEGEPTVSSDNKTLTFKIRSGIRYSPPLGGGQGVDRDVISADVKYAVERALLPSVSSAYATIYFDALVGFKQAQAAVEKDPTTAPDISGIQTPDDQTIVFKFEQPVAKRVEQALSLPISAPVPEEYAKQFDAETPSGYGEHQLATGPYYVTNYEPGKNITMERNPNWDASTDWRPAYLDKIDIQEGFTDTVSAGKRILTGSNQVNGDFSSEPQTLKLAATKYPDQLALTPSGGNRYVALNTSKPPFDDLNVRKAVVAGSNREDLRATRGGPLTGPVATHFIPPGIAGFEEAGGLAGPQGSEFDFVQNPKGDPDLAASYMKKAGFDSGKCEGSDCSITMVADNTPPGSNTAQVVKDQLSQLGFKVDLQSVTHDAMYTKFCGVPANDPNVCPNVGTLKDFNDPGAIVDIPFNGQAIVPSNNTNWPLLDVKSINDALDKVVLISDPQQAAEAWGKIDEDITAQAPAIPWIWDDQANIESADVAGVINLFNANWDVAYTSLTNP